MKTEQKEKIGRFKEASLIVSNIEAEELKILKDAIGKISIVIERIREVNKEIMSEVAPAQRSNLIIKRIGCISEFEEIQRISGIRLDDFLPIDIKGYEIFTAYHEVLRHIDSEIKKREDSLEFYQKVSNI
ncbi:MAG: hypothetical protein Q8S24_00045 [Eubacteriales bacterium]|nr:hypothetical protein [Eubacteriales bacterium]